METHGALVGWDYQAANDRVFLRIESVRTAADPNHLDPDIMRLLMTQQQAGLLAETLLKASGRVPAQTSKRSWLRRLIG